MFQRLSLHFPRSLRRIGRCSVSFERGCRDEYKYRSRRTQTSDYYTVKESTIGARSFRTTSRTQLSVEETHNSRLSCASKRRFSVYFEPIRGRSNRLILVNRGYCASRYPDTPRFNGIPLSVNDRTRIRASMQKGGGS